jgi:hypothetical protein
VPEGGYTSSGACVVAAVYDARSGELVVRLPGGGGGAVLRRLLTPFKFRNALTPNHRLNYRLQLAT